MVKVNMTLVIVESPTKAKTIQKFLGSEYKVLSSYGHIRDLPKSEFGVDVEHHFKPKYVIPTKSRKIVNFLKKEVQKSDNVILATDEDREGEAIAWHLCQVLNFKNYQRIVFHEITKQAIQEALKHPREIDINLVEAQQARRILDRIVGYQLSPFLWKKVKRGLSAGRVQSVAVRLIVDREREIQAFKPKEYWTVEAELKKQNVNQAKFRALLIKKNDKILDKFAIQNKNQADEIINELKEAEYTIKNIEKKETKRNPLPPFTTSTLQQEAFKRFHFPAKLTMQLAQQLYETGYITYHRTDSLNLSSLSLSSAKKFIIKNYGQNYYQFRQYKARGRVQEAHEAIRPTYIERTPDKVSLNKNQFNLYKLIWQRFVACQMAPAKFDFTIVDIEAKKYSSKTKKQAEKTNYIFRATGQVLKFDGFLKVYPIQFTENMLPNLEIGEKLDLIKLIPTQHFTQPPPRYTDATLVKALEENGIGRPSTYAPIISTIQERNYVQKDEQKRFVPTEIGMIVNDLLVEHFPKIVDLKFTAEMEENLDKIAGGEKQWVTVVNEFYQPFSRLIEQKYKEVSRQEFAQIATPYKCPKCSGQIVIRWGKFGRFYACSNFPDCGYTEPIEKDELNITCPKCKQGKIVQKHTKTKKIFYGCTRFPECDFAIWDKPTGEKCPKCGSLMVQTKKQQIKCSNKNCEASI